MSFTSRVLPRALIPVIAVTTALAIPAVASAHARLVSTDPPADASLATAPASVTATFNEELEPAFAAMTVVGPDQGQWAAAEPEEAGAAMTMALKPLGPAGTYTVNFRVTSTDGHVVEDSWSFVFTPPATSATGSAAAPAVTTSSTVAAPAATTATPDVGGLPAWPFLMAAPVLVVAAVLAFWALGRCRAQRR
ncbi:MAG: copper resistance CopC family protein [Mycobacterium sp.]